jgi:hypothetical protein
MQSNKKPTQQEIEQVKEILSKSKGYIKDGKIEAVKDYLLKKKYELRNSN